MRTVLAVHYGLTLSTATSVEQSTNSNSKTFHLAFFTEMLPVDSQDRPRESAGENKWVKISNNIFLKLMLFIKRGIGNRKLVIFAVSFLILLFMEAQFER